MGNSDAENRAKKIIEWMRDKPLSLEMLEPAFELAIAAAVLDAENRYNRERAGIISMLRDVSSRIGPAAMPGWCRSEIERIANLLQTWNKS